MRQDRGYTIIEAALAITLSASLIILTFGLSAMVGRQRFRDDLVTAQSFVQTQYNEVRSNINSRYGGVIPPEIGCDPQDKNGDSKAAANNHNCYIMGRLISFEKNNIKSSFIVGRVASTNGSWPDLEKTTLENLRSSALTLTAVTGKIESDAGLKSITKLISNETKVLGGWYIDGKSGQLIGKDRTPNMVILRSPVDGSLVIAVDVAIDANSKLDINRSKVINANSQRLAIGFVNGSLGYSGGVVCVAGGDNAAGVSNNFNVNVNWREADGDPGKIDASKIVEACNNWD